jgi:hypothetical protein
MAESKYTAPNDFRAFAESLGETEASLCHHGVKGMHWGERKYQDYNGRLTALGRQHYGYGAKKKAGAEEDASDKALKTITEKYNFNTKYTIRDKVVKDAITISKKWNETRNYDLHAGEKENKREFIKNEAFENAAIAGAAGLTIGGLTANPLVGLGVSGSSLGANSIISLGRLTGKNIKAHSANKKLENTIKEISENTNVDKATGLKKKNSEMSPDQDMAKVNPGFGNWSDNTKNNCFLCSTAYDLRRKGFDVTANGANDGYDATAALAWYPKASMIRLPSPPNFNKTMQNTMIKAFDTPDGGYGNLSVTWKKTGDGHSMIFAVENGQPVLRDCQTNKVYKGSACNKIFKEANELRYIRLDNVQPNINEMKKWGAINPAGQNFKLEQKANAEKAAKPVITSGKHGYTGALYREAQRIFHPLRDENEIYARDHTRTERKENQKKNKYAYKNSEEKFDGREFGLKEPIIRTSAYNLGEAKDSEHAGGNRAMYKTYYTNKNSSYVKLSFDADAESKESNSASVKQRVNDAKHVAEDEKRIVQQVPNKLQSSAIKKEYEKKYGYTQKDWNELSKSLHINEVILGEPDSKGRVRGIVNLGTNLDANRFGGTHFDCSFVTLPNGKVIILNADPTSND